MRLCPNAPSLNLTPKTHLDIIALNIHKLNIHLLNFVR